MPRPYNICICVLLSTLLLTMIVAAADEVSLNSEFLRLKTTYEKELQKIHDADLEIIVSEQDRYLGAVRNLKKQMQESGKLDPVLVLDREIDRFSAAKKIDVNDIAKDVPELLPLQNAYIRAIEKFPVEQARKIIALVQNYDKALGALQESLTKKNDIPGAVEVKVEKESLNNRAEAASAKALIMEYDARIAQEKQAAKITDKAVFQPGTVEKAVSITKPADDKSSGKKKYTGTPEKRVKQRYDEFVKALLKQDYTKASEFVDPDLVKVVGQNAIRKAFMGMFPFLQVADDPHRKLSVDSAKINEKGDKVTLIPKLWINNQWHNLPANKWIEVEGDWYLAIEEGEEMHRGDMKQMEREEPGRGVPRKPFKRMMDKR